MKMPRHPGVVQALPESLRGSHPMMTEQSQAIKSLHDVASKLFDVKGMLKFPSFDGRAQGFQGFKFRFESSCTILGLIEGIRWLV